MSLFCYKIYIVEAFGLKFSNYTLKILIKNRFSVNKVLFESTVLGTWLRIIIFLILMFFYPAISKQSIGEQSKSSIADHALQNNHVIDWNDAKVLQMECNSSARYIIWIRN